MEAAISRGRILREILKQDRLAPLPATFQMAWLVAFNDGRFEGRGAEEIPEALEVLRKQILHTNLTLDSDREAWSSAVSAWLGRNEHGESQ